MQNALLFTFLGNVRLPMRCCFLGHNLKERQKELDANDSGLSDVEFGEPLEGSIEC